MARRWVTVDTVNPILPTAVIDATKATDPVAYDGVDDGHFLTSKNFAFIRSAIVPKLKTTQTDTERHAAIMAAIVESVGTANPVTTTRTGKRPIEIPSGQWLINAPITTDSVLGLVIKGKGFCEIRANANMTSVFDLNGIAYSEIGGFTITGTAGVQVDNGFFTYWDNTEASRSNTQNVYHDIKIRNLDYITGFRVGKVGVGALQVDNDEFHHIHVAGAWTTGEATRYQNGLLLGTTISGNNLVHDVVKFSGTSNRFPLRVDNTNCNVYGGGIDGCDTAIWAQGQNVHVDGIDIEDAERLFFSPSSTANMNVEISNIRFRASALLANGRWIDHNMGGAMTLRNLFISSAAVHPVIITGNNPLALNVRGLSIALTSGLPTAEQAFSVGTGTILDAEVVPLTSATVAQSPVRYYGSPNAQTGTTYTFVSRDATKVVTLNNASAITATVPPNSSVPWPLGTQIELVQLGAGQVTVAPGSGVTINGTPGLKLRAQHSRAKLLKTATDTWNLSGDIAA